MFLDQDQMYLRMCNVNKEKQNLWKIYLSLFHSVPPVLNASSSIFIY